MWNKKLLSTKICSQLLILIVRPIVKMIRKCMYIKPSYLTNKNYKMFSIYLVFILIT